MIRIKNFTKSESFKTESEAKCFSEKYKDDSDIVHWSFSNGTELWIVYYDSNGYYEYPNLNV